MYLSIHASRTAYGKGAHDPEVCYPAQGWEIMGTRSVAVPLDDEETLTTKLLATQNGSRREEVLYWFQPARRWPATAMSEELLRVVDAVAGRPQYAFVRLSGPAGGDQMPEDLSAFAAEIAPAVRAVVDSIGSRT